MVSGKRGAGATAQVLHSRTARVVLGTVLWLAAQSVPGVLAAQEHFGHLRPSGILGKPFTRIQLLEILGKACRAAAAG